MYVYVSVNMYMCCKILFSYCMQCNVQQNCVFSQDYPSVYQLREMTRNTETNMVFAITDEPNQEVYEV